MGPLEFGLQDSLSFIGADEGVRPSPGRGNPEVEAIC